MNNTILRALFNRKTFVRGSALLATTTVLSYALGLLRDRLLAATFGASSILDAYNAAFIIPDLLLNIFIAGALSAAFVPIFSELEESLDERSTFLNSVLNSAISVILFVSVISFILAPHLAKIVAPGFDQEGINLYISLLRILLLSPIIFAISNTLGGILVSQERFFWYGLSAGLYNLGIILGILFLAPTYGIQGVAWGAIFGGLLHLLSRIVGLKSFPHRYSLQISMTAFYRKFIKLMIPKMVGHPIEQLTFMGYTIIASFLGAGSITVLNFARNFQSFPVAVIGVNLALAIFPVLSRAVAKNDRNEFESQFKFTAFVIIATTAISAILMFALKDFVVSLLLGGGEFDEKDIIATATTLGMFTPAIITESFSHLLSRSFYSLKNSITPVVTSILGLIIAMASGYLFSRSMGVPGLALGFVTGSLLKVTILYVLLKVEKNKKLIRLSS